MTWETLRLKLSSTASNSAENLFVPMGTVTLYIKLRSTPHKLAYAEEGATMEQN